MKHLAVLLLVISAAPAWAQSKKYPPEPVDKDAKDAQRSELWDAATNPNQAPYLAMVNEAAERLAARTRDAAVEAVGKLDAAVKLMPDEAEAYRVRGDAQMVLLDWAACASDFDAAWVRSKRVIDVKTSSDLRRKLGLCQARAGKLAEAEKTLAEAAATGVNNGEIWMRLGEVRIALGKLEEAIAALESASESSDLGSANALVKWLLAGAFDRARKPSEAAEAASRALAADRQLSLLKNPTLPFLGTGESDYLLGLACMAGDRPRAELSLVHFRRFLQLAPESPWRKRAEDHVKELRGAQFPETIERSGSAPLDETVGRKIIRTSMPAMRACAAKVPLTAFEVTIIKSGPRTRTTRNVRDVYIRPRYQAPPEGVRVEQHKDAPGGTPRAEADAAIRCIEPIARRIQLPAIKEKDAYLMLTFRVVGS